MLFFLPYRVKNPPKTFPYATLTLIIINVIVYIFTSDRLLSITEGAASAGDYAFGVSSILRFFSAVFLHAGPSHLIGNMLFLWVFGPPVEARLGVPKYLGVYFLTGFFGDILQSVLDVVFFGTPQMGIGASGCIMGIIGAYWYIFTWSTVCVAYFFWLFWFYIRYGVWEVAAIWIIGIYFVLDVINGMISGSLGGGGVANFCHVGGALAGALLCMLMRIKRDTQEVSDAKAIQADLKAIGLMPLHALETMAESDPCNPELIRAMIMPAVSQNRFHVVHEAMKRAGSEMLEKDPGLVAHYLTKMEGNHSLYKSVELLHLCSTLERTGALHEALAIYQIIVNAYPNQPDAETSLYRMAHLCWNNLKDKDKADRCLSELNRRFPNGSMAQFARNLQRQMSKA